MKQKEEELTLEDRINNLKEFFEERKVIDMIRFSYSSMFFFLIQIVESNDR